MNTSLEYLELDHAGTRSRAPKWPGYYTGIGSGKLAYQISQSKSQSKLVKISNGKLAYQRNYPGTILPKYLSFWLKTR